MVEITVAMTEAGRQTQKEKEGQQRKLATFEKLGLVVPGVFDGPYSVEHEGLAFMATTKVVEGSNGEPETLLVPPKRFYNKLLALVNRTLLAPKQELQEVSKRPLSATLDKPPAQPAH